MISVELQDVVVSLVTNTLTSTVLVLYWTVSTID